MPIPCGGKIRYQRNDIQQKNKFFRLSNIISGNAPFLFKICADQVIKTLVSGQEALDISKLCHRDPLGDTMVPITQQKKGSLTQFIGPIYKDATTLSRCGNLSS
ncbi:hypothetical protein Tco_1394098 [Tanacetum coccineum]